MFKFVFIFCLISNFGYSKDKVLTINKNYDDNLIGSHITYLEDTNNTLNIKDIIHSKNFLSVNKDIVNFNVSNSTFWLKITIKNESTNASNLIEIAQPLLEEIVLYSPVSNIPNKYNIIKRGQKYPFHFRSQEQSVNFLFNLNVKPGELKTYYIKIRSYKQILLPIRIIQSNHIVTGISTQTLWFGI